MPLSILAQQIYCVLRGRTPVQNSQQCKIRYAALVGALPDLPPPFANIHWRDPRLDQALGDLVVACQASALPAISAMVVNESGYPGNRYYPVAHPGVEDEEQRTIAWQHELEQVAAQTYPPLNEQGDIPPMN